MRTIENRNFCEKKKMTTSNKSIIYVHNGSKYSIFIIQCANQIRKRADNVKQADIITINVLQQNALNPMILRSLLSNTNKIPSDSTSTNKRTKRNERGEEMERRAWWRRSVPFNFSIYHRHHCRRHHSASNESKLTLAVLLERDDRNQSSRIIIEKWIKRRLLSLDYSSSNRRSSLSSFVQEWHQRLIDWNQSHISSQWFNLQST